MFIPVFLYSLFMCMTPGPNNAMLAASGAIAGFRKTVPLITGVILGFFSLLGLSALGLGLIFDRVPPLKTVLKLLGSAYLVYLALSLFISGNKGQESETPGRTPGLYHGIVLQFVNPKGLIASATAMSVYSLPGDHYTRSVLIIFLAFAITSPLSAIAWTAFGTFLDSLNKDPRYKKGIRLALGLITLVSVTLIWL